MACRFFCTVLSIILIRGSAAQEDPWPPLTSTCDVMPLIASDANKHGQNLLACASSSRPTCETIYCEILSNNDQLELELLPCWEHPAMWVTNRALDGKITYQNIFDSSKVVTANIGGKNVHLNVTVVQRDGLTLGFGIDMLMPGPQVRKIIPYRDIPLNLTECPGTDVPLMCKMILYMEQYIITSYSSRIRDPTMTPTCKRPKTDTCRSMSCMWNTYNAMVYHDYQLLPCSKPQAVRLIVQVGLAVVNTTFDESKVVILNETSSLNVTLKHISEQTIGFQVDFIYLYGGNVTEIPYTELPMETSGCPPPHKDTSSFHRHVISLHKERRSSERARLGSSNSTAANSSFQTPLISSCDIVPLMVDSMNSVPNQLLRCSSHTGDPCNQINCTITDTGDILQVNIQPCTTPPSLHFTVMNNHSVILSNRSVDASAHVNLNITSITFPVAFTIVQHTNYITMGLSVMATLSDNNVTIVPYYELPMNRTMCQGAITPSSPTCAAMQNIAQYLNVYFRDQNGDIGNPWDCSLYSGCTNVTCSVASRQYHSIAISPCDRTLTILSSDGFNYTFARDGMVMLGNDSILNFMIHYDASRKALGLEITVLSKDANNDTLIVPVVPYVDVPLNLTSCPSSSGSTLITTCDLMPQLAANTTDTYPNLLQCSSSLPPDCNTISCHVASNDRDVSIQVLPCDNPPAIELTTTDTNFTIQRRYFDSSGSFEVPTSNESFTVYMVQHPHQLTLGLRVIYNSTNGSSLQLIPYHEIPLNTDSCPKEPHKTKTCQVMDSVVQYLNVYIANMTHTPSHCEAVRSSLCNNITCFQDPSHPSRGGFNMTFLPCGDSIGFHAASGNATYLGYNFTIFKTTLINYTRTISGNITLDHLNKMEVGFRLELFVNDTSIGDEVPYVKIPVDRRICGSKSPENHTTDNNRTISGGLISTCDIMPLLADEASTSLNGSLTCTSSGGHCNTVHCVVMGSGEEISLTVVPCSNPPTVRLSTTGTQQGSSSPLVRNLTSSEMIELYIGGSPVPLYVNIMQHSSKLSLGLEVIAGIMNTDASVLPQNVTFVRYKEIPIDRSSCPTTSVVSALCAVMNNISQYVNVILGNASAETTDCFPSSTSSSSGACNRMTCRIVRNESSFSFVLIPCNVPPAIMVVTSASNGTVMFNETVTDSKILNWSVFSALNMTILHFNSSTIGLQVDLLDSNSTKVLNMVPMVQIPLNITSCSKAPPTYSNNTLVSTCQITPIVADSAFPIGIDTLHCTSSLPPNCTTITCTVPRTNDSVKFEFRPCFSSPAVTIYNYVSGAVVQYHTISETTTYDSFILGGKRVSMTVTLVEHDVRNLGFKVDVEISPNGTREFIPYREIPFDPTQCTTAHYTPTCKIMNNVAQYVMVFVANHTIAMDTTPDCHADRSSLCNNITCVMPGNREIYKGNFLVCQDPIAFNFVHIVDGNTVVDSTYALSAMIEVKDEIRAHMTLDYLSDHIIQFEMYLDSFGGNLVPSVRIPLDSRRCRLTPPPPTVTTGPTVTTRGTDKHDSVSSLFVIEITVPLGVITISVVLILSAVICIMCCRQKKLSDDPYSFKPLTDKADAEDEDKE